ncbi:MAG: hypothetical protein LBG57_11530 [Treponema sp.]|jgi:hypothetical protein|nr:hypothetical protein [Treponema sp.]
MKKFIALSLVLALAVGAVFAELKIGGQAGIGVTAVSGTSEDDSVLGAGISDTATGGRIEAVYSNDPGSFGALVRVKPLEGLVTGTDRVFAWWQPLPQVKLTLGKDGNGQFALNYLVAATYHHFQAEDYVAYGGYGMTRFAWSYVGFTDLGAALTLTPLKGLAINVGVPYDKSEEAEEVYKHTTGQVTYDIADVGQIGVTFVGGAGYSWDTTNSRPVTDPSAVYAQFYLTAIKPLQLNVGLKYSFPGDFDMPAGPAGSLEVKAAYPIAAGFGLNYNISNTIGVKARLAAAFAGSQERSNGVTVDEPLRLGFDLMPYFDLGFLRLFLNTGIGYTAETANPGTGNKIDDSQVFSWYINPYITKSVGPSIFYVGFQLYSDGSKVDVSNPMIPVDKDPIIGWAIPLGIQVFF